MTASDLKDIKLYYFSKVKDSLTMGRGEPVRLLLEDAGVDYEYVRLTADQWKEKKAELIKEGIPGPTMPYITINGKHYAKTVPAMRFLAKKLGKYLGENDDEEHLLDAYADFAGDWTSRWATTLFRGSDEDKKVYAETTFPQTLDTVEQMLSKSSGPYLLGERITYADFLIFHQLDDDNQAKVDSQKHPHLAAFVEAIKNRPSLQKHFNSLKQ
ncbi:glutathione S-transferase [Rhizopus microsporus var. microsporus]|uniref:Class gamma glutathione S-transferase n=2 Tax=Rhizopus microsporus TaxID=58291 RepID=A0A2G4SMS2_RHIZD|nr:class gamma glutathione S-transferase [Rhizopus microsporus ATCC 52813]ORE11129.1 glutathione S-transferase [Rhizopus microsporus var. microsporus]PHZ10042.1 class gamma glutathione S-transferase [Rhizopus microsporus ATCC 52813]